MSRNQQHPAPTLGAPLESGQLHYGVPQAQQVHASDYGKTPVYHPVMKQTVTPFIPASNYYYVGNNGATANPEPAKDYGSRKTELENTVLKQRVADLEQEIETMQLDAALPNGAMSGRTAMKAELDTATKQWHHYQQAYELVMAAIQVTNPQMAHHPLGTVSEEQLAHKIKCKLDILTAQNRELLQMCAILNKLSLITEIALLRAAVPASNPRRLRGGAVDAPGQGGLPEKDSIPITE